jgi:hypothetical protein
MPQIIDLRAKHDQGDQDGANAANGSSTMSPYDDHFGGSARSFTIPS